MILAFHCNLSVLQQTVPWNGSLVFHSMAHLTAFWEDIDSFIKRLILVTVSEIPYLP